MYKLKIAILAFNHMMIFTQKCGLLATIVLILIQQLSVTRYLDSLHQKGDFKGLDL